MKDMNIEINRKELVGIFKDLLNIYSPSRDEIRAMEYAKDFLQKLGCEIYLDENHESYGGDCPTLFAMLSSNGGKRDITLSAHLDVVEPNEGLTIVEDEEIIRSSGNTTLGGDDKAGVATILYVMKYFKERNLEHGNIYCILTPGEESGMLGAKCIDWEKVYGAMKPEKRMIVLDNAGSSDKIAHSAPCAYNWTMEGIGRSAHAGIEPEKGINAIHLLTKALSEMEFGRISSDTTANVSRISSDFPSNVVPRTASAFGEIRSHREERVKEILDSMDSILKKYFEEYNFEYRMDYPVLKPTDDLAFAKEFKEVYKSIGVEAELQIIGGGSDANFFSKEGFNSVIIGVGMNKVHTFDEYLEVKEMETAARVVIKYLMG